MTDFFVNKYKSRLFMPIVAFLFFCVGSTTYGQKAPEKDAPVRMGERQLIMLKPGLGAVYGSSIFAVQNESKAAKRGRFDVMLPKETLDFQVQEGAQPEDLHLSEAENGELGAGAKKGLTRLYVERDFPPGTTIVSIGFLVNANTSGDRGEAVLSLIPTVAGAVISVMTPKGQLNLKSTAMRDGSNVDQAHGAALPPEQYDTLFLNEPTVIGKSIEVMVSGIPTDRSQYWEMGTAFAALLLGLAGTLAWRTRPHLAAGDGAAPI